MTTSHLNKAADELKDVIEYIREKKMPYFGDLTNRFFPALYLPDQIDIKTLAYQTKSYQELIKKLECLNKRMVVAN